MTYAARERILAETQAARVRAQALLNELLTASAECESQLSKQSRKDPIRLVTGRSSLETAIANTRRIIETLDRALSESHSGGPSIEGSGSPVTLMRDRMGQAALA